MKKARIPEEIQTINTQIHGRIFPQGFKALHHLLHASKHLHDLADLPLDGRKAAALLVARIASDLERLGGCQ